MPPFIHPATPSARGAEEVQEGVESREREGLEGSSSNAVGENTTPLRADNAAAGMIDSLFRPSATMEEGTMGMIEYLFRPRERDTLESQNQGNFLDDDNVTIPLDDDATRERDEGTMDTSAGPYAQQMEMFQVLMDLTASTRGEQATDNPGGHSAPYSRAEMERFQGLLHLAATAREARRQGADLERRATTRVEVPSQGALEREVDLPGSELPMDRRAGAIVARIRDAISEAAGYAERSVSSYHLIAINRD